MSIFMIFEFPCELWLEGLSQRVRSGARDHAHVVTKVIRQLCVKGQPDCFPRDIFLKHFFDRPSEDF